MYVSYMYDVTISYLHLVAKKQERGLILIKVYGYIIFQFSPIPTFFSRYCQPSTQCSVFSLCLFSVT